MHRRRNLVPALLLPLALAACSDGGEGADRERPDRDNPFGLTDEQRARAKDDLPPCTTEPTETDGLTDPGQVLCFGTAARLPLGGIGSDSYTGSMRLTMTGFERGDDAAIDDTITSGYPEWTSQSRDLWFFRAEAELLEADVRGDLDSDDATSLSTSVSGVGGELGDRGITGGLDGCDRLDFEDGGGEPFGTCDWALLEPGVEPWSVRWGDTDDYLLDNVVWAAE